MVASIFCVRELIRLDGVDVPRFEDFFYQSQLLPDMEGDRWMSPPR